MKTASKQNMHKKMSAVIPVVITLLLSLCVLLVVWLIMKDEVKQSSEKSADYFVSNIESEIDSISSFTYDWMLNTDAIALAQTPAAQVNTSTTINTVWRLHNSIRNNLGALTIIEDITYYFPSLDTTVSKLGCLDTDQILFLPNLDLFKDTEALQARFEELFYRQNGSFFHVYNSYSQQVEFYYLRCNPINAKAQEANMIVLVRFNAEAISEMLKDISHLMNFQYAALVTDDGQIFAQYADPEIKKAVATETILAELKNNSTASSYSSLLSMSVFLFQSTNTMVSLIQIGIIILLIGLFFAACVGMGLSLLGHKQRETSINFLKQLLGASTELTLDDAIQRYMAQTTSRDQEAQEKLKKQQIRLNSSFFRELIIRNDSSDKTLDKLRYNYNISFDNDHFGLFCLNSRTKVREHQHSQQILQILLEEDISSSDIYWTDFNYIQFFLYGYDNENTSLKDLEILKNKLEQVLSEKVHSSNATIENAEQILTEFMFLHQLVAGKGLTASIKIPTIGNIFEQTFIYLTEGSPEQLKSLLPSLMAELQANKQDKKYRCERYAFLSRLYRVPELTEDHQLIDKMFNDFSVQTWEHCLQSFHQVQIDDTFQPPKKYIAAQVVEIIANEYSNPQMGLALLSSRLDVTQSYLSRSFKARYGENISHYLNRVRISHAKELISSGNDNLNSIAQQVGFLNDISMIRVFKRLENETPGNYRKNSQIKE